MPNNLEILKSYGNDVSYRVTWQRPVYYYNEITPQQLIEYIESDPWNNNNFEGWDIDGIISAYTEDNSDLFHAEDYGDVENIENEFIEESYK